MFDRFRWAGVAAVAVAAGFVGAGVVFYQLHAVRQPPPRQTIVIAVDKDGTITLNGEVVTEEELDARMRARAAPKAASPP